MEEDDDEDEIELKPPRPITDCKHFVCIECIPFEEMHEKLKNTIATDQTRRFLITSARGNTSMMVMYDYDRNLINATATKNRISSMALTDCIKAYKKQEFNRFYTN